MLHAVYYKSVTQLLDNISEIVYLSTYVILNIHTILEFGRLLNMHLFSEDCGA